MIANDRSNVLHSSSVRTSTYSHTPVGLQHQRVFRKTRSKGQKSQGFMFLDTQQPTVPAQPPQYGESYALLGEERHAQERDDRANSKNG